MTSVEPLAQPLLTVAVLHLLAAMSPGPSFITVSRTTLASGRPAGLASAPACGLGMPPWAIGAILGMVIIYNQAPWLYAVLNAVGGLYLLYLVVMVWRHAVSPIGVVDGIQRQMLSQAFSQAFGQTFLIQITNPKVAVFSAIEVAWHSIVVLGLSAARPRALHLRLKSVLDHAMVALLGAFGVKLLTDTRRCV
jgi:threonine/homoserine/homoserine lactone efflux protein